MHQERRARGFTIMEVLCATALLLFMWLTIMCMFSLSVGLANSNRRVYQASALAEKKLEEVRVWSQTVAAGRANFLRFGSSDDPYQDASGSDPLYPFMTWSVQEEWETQATDVHQLTRSARKVLVTVSWQEGTRTRSVALGGLVAEPVRPLGSLNIAATALLVSLGNFIDLSVTATDVNGDEIPDLTYRWTVLPHTADGVLSVNGATSHIGPTVRLTATRIQAGSTSGTLIVGVAARCGGVDLQTATASISVTP